MDKINNKRKGSVFNKHTLTISKSLFLKVLIPFLTVILVNSIVLFFGLQFLLSKASFINYGLAPLEVSYSVSQFISIHILIFVISTFLMFILTIVILYITLHDLILPLARITNDLNSGEKKSIFIRQKDVLLIPLVKSINKRIKN